MPVFGRDMWRTRKVNIKKQIFAVVLTLGLSGSSQVHAATDWYRVARVGGRIGCFTGGVGCVTATLALCVFGIVLADFGRSARKVACDQEADLKTTKNALAVAHVGVDCVASGFCVLAYVGAFGMFAGAVSTAMLSVPLFYFALRK